MAIGAIAAPTAGASNGTTVPTKVTKVPPLYAMNISGAAKNGKKFTGTYGIQRFVAWYRDQVHPEVAAASFLPQYPPAAVPALG